MRFQKIQVIINPAAGKPRPVLHIMHSVFHPRGVEWQVDVTKNPADVRDSCRRAIDRGVEAVAVYGGDGTVMEAVNGLAGTTVPLAILPGGTANIMATELGIPRNLTMACSLLCNDRALLHALDIGDMMTHHFILRLSAGFEAEIVKTTHRRLKSNVGMLAYMLSGFKALLKTRPTRYRIVLDGVVQECLGLSYVVANSGCLGFPGVTLSPKIKVDDGLLDVIFFRATDLRALFSLDFDRVEKEITTEFFQHWQAREVTIEAETAHNVQCDGEFLGPVQVKAKVIPQALKVIVPKIPHVGD